VGFGAVRGDHVSVKGLDAIGADEVDGAAAESGASQARAEDIVLRVGEGAEQIELWRADVVVVAQALVGLAHQAAEVVEVVALERFDGAGDARDLGDDVARAARRDVGSGLGDVE